jgi:hypothetical protein
MTGALPGRQQHGIVLVLEAQDGIELAHLLEPELRLRSHSGGTADLCRQTRTSRAPPRDIEDFRKCLKLPFDFGSSRNVPGCLNCIPSIQIRAQSRLWASAARELGGIGRRGDDLLAGFPR